MIAIILLLSGLLRLIGINQSMWLDEAITANIASRYDYWNIIDQFSKGDFHPPFYYFFLNFWAKIFGNSVISLRLTSVLLSLLTIYFVYLIGKQIKNKTTGLWAAAFLGLNPLFVYYSQEMRMYTMSAALMMLALYNFLKIDKSNKPKIKNIIGFNLAAFLSFLNFYGSIFLLATMSLYFLLKKKYKTFFISSIGTLTSILVLSPLIFIQFNNSKIMLNEVSNWSLVLGKANLKNILLIPLKFSIGRISFYPKIVYYLIGSIWSLIVFGSIVKSWVKSKKLIFLFIFPLIMAFIFSIFSPLLNYNRFLYLIPIVALLLALLVNTNKNKIFLLAGFTLFSLMYLLNPSFHRENWKKLSDNLDNTKPLYIIESTSDPVKYYRPDVIIKDIKTREINEDEVVVVPYAETLHDFDHKIKLENLGFKLTGITDYREVTLETWKKQK
jgi:uncharacterized membrane protein